MFAMKNNLPDMKGLTIILLSILLWSAISQYCCWTLIVTNFIFKFFLMNDRHIFLSPAILFWYTSVRYNSTIMTLGNRLFQTPLLYGFEISQHVATLLLYHMFVTCSLGVFACSDKFS